MMNAFVNGLRSDSNITYTENGAQALKSTNSDIVDLFGIIGALRSRTALDIERLFSKAFAEDSLLATKMAFYARNVRGGLGERNTARVIWKWLANTHPEIMRKNLVYIPFFGRWDDLYCLVDTPVEDAMWELIRCQYSEDVEAMNEGKSVSLMAKWMKNPNSSNAETAKLGMRTARSLHMSDKKYRKAMAALRGYIGVVEVAMSNGDYTSINYSAVTSGAMLRYRKAFAKRDEERFASYLESLEKGETHINSATLYPYNIMESYGLGTTWGGWNRKNYLCLSKSYDAVLEQQWKALPNYVDGENNVLVMADTSGSMEGRPLATSVGLAVYFAERNRGAFHNSFMTFSLSPNFVTLKGNTLRDKVSSIECIIENTNIQAAFEKILTVSKENNVPAEDMPKALIIISDMEFDRATSHRSNTYYETMRRMYEASGYTLPTVVFWNVASRHDVFHAVSDQPGVMMASGQSASTFKAVLNNIGKTPYQAVLDVLNSEEYAMITV